MKIGKLLIKAYDILKKENIESYMIDAQLLLCKVLEVPKLHLILNRDEYIDYDKEVEFFQLIDKRRNRMPIKYILGSCEFMSLNFKIREGVLIPRPDTEILVEECIKIINKNEFKYVCDMCCGSGAIGLSIAKYTQSSRVWLYDISDVALKVTEENIMELGLEGKAEVSYSNLFNEAIENNLKFNIIVSNPPYIKTEIIPTLMEDVKSYEPFIALCGGDDGLNFYRDITIQSKKVLLPGGYLTFEIGHDQENEVKEIMNREGFLDIYALKDLAGNPRVVVGKLP